MDVLVPVPVPVVVGAVVVAVVVVAVGVVVVSATNTNPAARIDSINAGTISYSFLEYQIKSVIDYLIFIVRTTDGGQGNHRRH